MERRRRRTRSSEGDIAAQFSCAASLMEGKRPKQTCFCLHPILRPISILGQTFTQLSSFSVIVSKGPDERKDFLSLQSIEDWSRHACHPSIPSRRRSDSGRSRCRSRRWGNLTPRKDWISGPKDRRERVARDGYATNWPSSLPLSA